MICLGLISRHEMTGYSELGDVRSVASADLRGQAFVVRPCPEPCPGGLQRVTKVRLNFAASFEACPSEDLCGCISSCVWPSHHTSITVYNTPVSPLAKWSLLCLKGLRIN